MNYFKSKGIFTLLIVVVDQISQILEKLWNYEVMATGLACVDVVEKLFNLDVVGISKVNVVYV